MAKTTESTEATIREVGESLWADMRGQQPGFFAKDYWASKLLDWAMQDPEFKVDLFRLVDVLPALRSTEQVQAHLQEYLLRPGRDLPTAITTALRLSQGALTGKVAAGAIRRGVSEMGSRFILGETVSEAIPVLHKMHKDGLAHTVDLLGEATLSDKEAEIYEQRYIDLLDTLAAEVSDWKPDAVIDGGEPGTAPRSNVSLKITALEPHLDPVDPEGSVERVLRRAMPVVEAAKDHGIFINFDVEQYAYHEITYRLFERIAESPKLKDWPHLGIVVQAYCVHAERYLERLLELARRRGAPVTIRLVKGAYWDYEVIQADQHGHPTPVFTRKSETDAHYERLTTWLLKHREELPPAIGSHNLRSVVHALAEAESVGVPKEELEFQTLYGMAEPLRDALRKRGYRVRVYSPVGELLPGMAYLVRRLLENTANEGFLRLTYHEEADVTMLLAPPEVVSTEPAAVPHEQREGEAFRNCPHADFGDPDVQARFAGAVSDAASRFPLDVPVVVNGEEHRPGGPHARQNPCDVDQTVAQVHYATNELAEKAVERAMKAWPGWRDTPLDERAGVLDALADRLEADRDALAAVQVYESGKPWTEADADITEAVDFCRYYAHRAPIELGPERLGNVYGEVNHLFYQGRGPSVVIAPWNFPLAILCGMTTASLVAGNTVIMKPAEQSSGMAYALYAHMRDAGFPPEAVQFLPGQGEEIGPLLVNHPAIAQIAFTGSRAVGLSIVEQAGRTREGQRQVKRVVCEMGGKNGIVVDADADLDEAVAGVVYSAYGYAGQKCSACSRAIVVGDAYEPFLERLTAACASLTVGPAAAPDCQVPAVIDEDAHTRLMRVIESPGEGAKRLYCGQAPSAGWYVPATLFEVDDADHRLMQEELFGPVLTLMRVDTFEEALRVANHTDYALTGAVFTRRPSHMERARAAFRVGNLYLNRGCTGSMVGRQAFGGFHMSGAGTKAGGPGYLRHFADPRSVTENTMRRGFSPEVSL